MKTALGLLLILASGMCQAQTQFESILPSIVSVLPLLSGGRQNLEEPEGSGIVVEDGQKIVTATHVLNGAQSVLVRTFDGEYIAASIIWKDTPTDIALLSIAKKLKPGKFHSVPDIGAPVCAAGNSFGLGISLSCGVVSAKNRTGIGFNAIEDFIQTDASVNPGKSGGALVDGNGRIIGMLSAIFTKNSDANIGINFAVSTRLLKALFELKSENPRASWRRNSMKLKSYPPRGETGISGAQIVDIKTNSRADEMGFKNGDIIIRSGLRQIRKPTDFKIEFAIYEQDDMPITIVRNNSEMQLTWRFKGTDP